MFLIEMNFIFNRNFSLHFIGSRIDYQANWRGSLRVWIDDFFFFVRTHYNTNNNNENNKNLYVGAWFNSRY